jgi:hypothetical protein
MAIASATRPPQKSFLCATTNATMLTTATMFVNQLVSNARPFRCTATSMLMSTEDQHSTRQARISLSFRGSPKTRERRVEMYGRS